MGDCSNRLRCSGVTDPARFPLFSGAYAGVLLDTEPAVDGIFRAVPHGLVEPGAVSVISKAREVTSVACPSFI